MRQGNGLKGTGKTVGRKNSGARWRRVDAVFLAGALVFTALWLAAAAQPAAPPPEAAGGASWIIAFKGKAPFDPASLGELADALREGGRLPEGLPLQDFRFTRVGGIGIGYFRVTGEEAKNAAVEVIRNHPRLEGVDCVAATPERLRLLAEAPESGGGAPTAAAAAAPAGPPRILATVPAVGAADVDPAIEEITVTFDQDMRSGFSWTGGGPEYPPIREGARPYWKDSRTCALPVRLEAGKYYRVGINSKSHQNFCGVSGNPAPPSAIYFTTRGASAELQAQARAPQIVSMNPPNGATGVDPNLGELRVEFDLPMGGGFSWTGGGPQYPAIREGQAPYWTPDRKTCALPVRLEPDHSYRLGLNSPSHKNFQSEHGVPLEPVVYTFTTGSGQ